MTTEAFLALRWFDDDRPLVEPPFPSPILADPTFLFPSETAAATLEGAGAKAAHAKPTWALFAHTAFGIRRYISEDGLAWQDRGQVVANAMRAFVRRIDGEFILAYEKYRPFALPLQLLPRRPRWHSRLEARRSADLERWSEPEVLLEPDFAWARAPGLGESLSNPCLVPTGSGWRLWFSASLVTIADCGFDEPRFIACADAAAPTGPFAAPSGPRLAPSLEKGDDLLGEGSIKVIELEDGWIGLQNKIFRGIDGRSRSAIFLLRSEDGLSFRAARREPLLGPSSGWRSSHVYACDCRRDPEDGSWYLYYNARDGWYKTKGRERIGRLVGREK
ncbi:MAG TPA: hypothetical protein VMV83_04260 [Rectinemataceae bacterium]|nr:hypothetical protein [Rectinemataceae bacterium]